MRSPWNTDPTPFMTRHGSVYGYKNNFKPSGCSEYHNAFNMKNWMKMSKQLNAAAHGHLHELMGGSWNHDYSDFENGEVHPAVLTFAHAIQALSKDMWRVGYVACPTVCDMSTASSDCTCTKDPS